MSLCREDTRVADAIFQNPALLTILDRFGIYIGVGDATFSEICARKGEDVRFILAIINTYLHEDYFPEKLVESFPLTRILAYLEKTDEYYREVLLPNIDRHFASLVKMSGGEDNNLHLLRGLASEMRTRILERVENDARIFPRLHVGDDNGEIVESSDVSALLDADDAIEDTLLDLISFFVIHLRGAYNRNLCLAVVSALFTLERDIRQNNRIRRLILAPAIDSIF